MMMSALGDAVHVLPIVTAIKRSAPTSRITWVVEGPASRLMMGHPQVDEVVVARRGLAGLRELAAAMRGRKFDILLDLQVALKAGLATLVIPARQKIGFDRARARDLNWLFTSLQIPAHEPQHVQDQYAEFLTYLGIPFEPIEWNLGPWPGEEHLADSLLTGIGRPIASLGIATSRDEKDWVSARWAELADKLHRDFGMQPVLLGGPAEKDQRIAAEIQSAATAPIISTVGCSLRELVSVIHRSALVVSLDTAPLHMSVALNVPVVSLMGFSNPRRVGPCRRFTHLVVDRYTNHGEVPSAKHEYRFGRMELISVAEVVEKVALARADSG